METWFILAVASAFFAGFQTFTYKIGAERNYDVPLLPAYAAFVSFVCLCIVMLIASDPFVVSFYVTTLSVFLVALFMVVNLLRNAALQCIDTAIYFPIYKVLGPFVVIVAGITFLSESFSAEEWIGILLSLTVPLLLISRTENGRQKDLLRGIKLLCVTVLVAVGVTFIAKEIAVTADNIWTTMALQHLLMALLGASLFMYRCRNQNLRERIVSHTTVPFVRIALFMGVTQAIGFGFLMFAYKGGPIGIVYTINSLYILVQSSFQSFITTSTGIIEKLLQSCSLLLRSHF
jgi:drug/metabolite transporter (DMT)-like permease